MKKIIPLMFLFCGCNMVEIVTIERAIEVIIEGAESPEDYPPEDPKGLNGPMPPC